MTTKTTSYNSGYSRNGLKERKKHYERTEDIDEFLRQDESKSMLVPEVADDSKDRYASIHQIGAIILTVLSFFVRFYKIDLNKNVVWDEAHFGKFGSYYIKHQFYHDVHPPLGKMLIALSEWLAGFDGNFSFDSNSKYPSSVNFKAMRQFNSFFGAMCVPLAFYTAKNMKLSMPTTYLVALMVCLEHSYIVLSKFILLDSILLFFTLLTFFSLIKFTRCRTKELSISWYFWLLATGASIGCVCSVKWVGVFVTSIVGLYTIIDLYALYYNSTVTRLRYGIHWVSRILSLIIIPFCFYLLFFKIHFSLLYKSGKDDSAAHSLFQANLEGTHIKPSPRNIAFGSEITIRSHGLSPTLLHSHVQHYPMGSKQRQVTGYGFQDDNNKWILKFSRESGLKLNEDGLYENSTTFIKDRDAFRLVHKSTQNNLHTHKIPSLVSKGNFEVSGYGDELIGDAKDDWIIEVVEQLPLGNNTLEDISNIHPLTTNFRLKNKELGCYLATSGMIYPSWGFSQAEIVCKYTWSSRDKATWWNIEDHSNVNLEIDESFVPPKSNFFTDFVVINFAMAASNNALVPDPDKFDRLASEPWEWPSLHKGLRLCSWGSTTAKYYLIGSPFNTWLSAFSILAFVLYVFSVIIRYRRQVLDITPEYGWHFISSGVLPFLSWSAHYLPFFLMGRVKYVHHYLPALYFAILTFGFLLDITLKNRRNAIRYPVYSALYLCCILVYWYFSPLCQGMSKKSSSFRYLELLPSWNIS